MARGEQLGRQWLIIRTLIASRTGKSAGELAEELDINPRTVYRDLEALQEAGFPIYTDRVEGKNLWSLLDRVKHQIPIPFSLTELMALYFSRDMLDMFKGTAYYDSLESLFKKIKTTLPPESMEYLENVDQTLRVVLKPRKEYARFREIINRVNEAAVNRKSVEIVYHTLSRREKTRRVVDPYRVLFFSGTFYLMGYCHLRDEVRIFALDRIKMLHLTGEEFLIPEGFDPDDFMKPSFGIFQGEPVRVKVLFDADVAEYIKEKTWHESQEIAEREDGSLVYEAEVAGTQEIMFWIMSWGSHALVLEPESLREQIRTEIDEMKRRYGTAAGAGKGRKRAGTDKLTTESINYYEPENR